MGGTANLAVLGGNLPPSLERHGAHRSFLQSGFPDGAAPRFAGLFVIPRAGLKPRRKTSFGFQRTSPAVTAGRVD
ncbi:MAG: hypothetical protein DME18_15185 [Verrucomicrobia bacterium]|nr:MAG: hypothetical protein DME18_15185 [Verrucomicrobiota bacterium]